jgi:hypothetical protein
MVASQPDSFAQAGEMGIGVLCFMQFGRLPHQKIMESIKRMGRYVIPYFL